MSNKSKHGGSRPPIREDDGRLVRKMENPVKVTISLEKNHLDQLKTRYKRDWQDVVRSLIKLHLEM